MKNLKLLTLALFALLLAACGGGGGGGGGNPANPIPPDAAEFSVVGFSANAETVDDAAESRPNFGSITQSSNSSNGVTTDSFAITLTEFGYNFSKTNSADPSKSWAAQQLDIVNDNNNSGSGNLYFTNRTEIPIYILVPDIDLGSTTRISVGVEVLTHDVLISRIGGNQFAYMAINNETDGDDWVVGGFWNVLNDHDNKMNGFLDDIRSYVNSSLMLDYDGNGCSSPCRISSSEVGAFVDGSEWNDTLPVSGSATYGGEFDVIEGYDTEDPNYPHDYSSHNDYGFVTLMVTFGGNNGTSIEGIIGDELSLSATDWDPNRGDYGAFYGENKISCAGGAELCQSMSHSIFAAQFFGSNDVNDGMPNLIGGVFSVDNLQERGYIDDNYNLVETPIRKDVIGGFTGEKQ